MRLFGSAVVAVCSSLGCGEDGSAGTSNSEKMGMMAAGNGAPSGAHYSLNIIGVQKGKSADMTGDNGHRIFVPLSGTTKILLSEGDFAVLDANGTDGSAAFQLPSPDPDNNGETEYSVYVRALGMPGGSATIIPTATDPVTGEVFASTLSTVVVRETGKSSFTNVSKTLLYIYADVNGDGIVDRVPLFDSRLQDFYWSYDNQGLKLAQLRFYEVPTIIQ
jgi:hypothetical protein